MKLNTKLIFDKEKEGEEAQSMYEAMFSINMILNMSGLNCIESSLVDCEDTIELKIEGEFSLKDLEILKNNLTQMEGVDSLYSTH